MAARRTTNERALARLRPVVPGPHQLGRVHLLRRQLLQAAHRARLAQPRHVLGVHRGPVRRDVRLPADHLSALRLAGQALSRRGLPLPRSRPPAGDDVRLARQPPLRPLPPSLHHLHRGRLLAAGRGLEGAVRGPEARRLATSGPYARLRHPQYAAFVLIMFGFLLQWPTLITLAMFPILVTAYVHLARRGR